MLNEPLPEVSPSSDMGIARMRFDFRFRKFGAPVFRCRSAKGAGMLDNLASRFAEKCS
jgi:hypothetical protein